MEQFSLGADCTSPFERRSVYISADKQHFRGGVSPSDMAFLTSAISHRDLEARRSEGMRVWHEEVRVWHKEGEGMSDCRTTTGADSSLACASSGVHPRQGWVGDATSGAPVQRSLSEVTKNTSHISAMRSSARRRASSAKDFVLNLTFTVSYRVRTTCVGVCSFSPFQTGSVETM